MKRIICIILAVFLLLSPIAALPVFAADDGTNDALEAEGYVGISTEEELKTVESNFYLKNDIVFTSGIGVPKEGIIKIHGNGHTIYFAGGISVMESCQKVTIEDLRLAGNVIITEGSFGDIAPNNYGPLLIKSTDTKNISYVKLNNVHSTVNITVLDESFSGAVGGIMGSSDGLVEISNCSYTGTISLVGDLASTSNNAVNVGGMAGSIGDSLTASNLRANAKIIVDGQNIEGVGGLFGKLSSRTASTVLSSTFDGSVTVRGKTRTNSGVGGIVGYVGSSKYSFGDLINNGEIKLQAQVSSASVGGIVGLIHSSATYFSFFSVINTGNIEGLSIAGGIVGSTLKGSSIKTLELNRVKNSGSVTASDKAGGIIGYLAGSNQATVTNTLNEGTVSALNKDADGVAGIVGYMAEPTKQTANLLSTYNTGVISGANPTPLLFATGYDTANAEKNYYTNDIEGEHVGQKITPEEMEKLIDRISFLRADTTELENLLDSLNKFPSNDYTTESWQKFLAAVTPGLALLKNPTMQWEIDEAVENIKDAIEQLELTEQASKELDEIYDFADECSKLLSTDYTSSSWNNLQNAILKIQNGTSTSAIREAYAEAVAARESLVYIRDLRRLLNKVPTNESAYPTSGAWMIAKAAIKRADSVLLSGNATQEQVDSAIEALQQVLDTIENVETSGTDYTDYTDITDTSDETQDPYMSDLEELKKAWLEYLESQGMTPPETDEWGDVIPPPDSSEALQLAWQAFLAQQAGNSGTVGSIGGTDNPNTDKATLAIVAGAAVLIIAIAVALSFRRKND